MTWHILSLVLCTFTLAGNGIAKYTLTEDFTYDKFFPAFDFFNGTDPTGGFVQYQTLEQAINTQLIGYLNESIYIGADYTKKAPQGRPSIRISSQKSFNQGLLIADIYHMPSTQCGNWPALWMLGSGTWPENGEIDIIEGKNLYTTNAMTLHTDAGCFVDNATTGGQGSAGTRASFFGSMQTDNCDVNASDQQKNAGCSVKAPASTQNGTLASYGTDFNNAGGGVYAMEWTTSSISVWFFSRKSTIPDMSSPDPTSWGTPMAKFAGSGCDFSKKFKDMKIIINLTFCGQWAGDDWAKDGCAKKTGVATCNDYVANHPEAFSEAYWEIAGLKYFQDGAGGNSKRAVIHESGRPYSW